MPIFTVVGLQIRPNGGGVANTISFRTIRKECPGGQKVSLDGPKGKVKSYKSIQICQIILFYSLDICSICKDLKDFFDERSE